MSLRGEPKANAFPLNSAGASPGKGADVKLSQQRVRFSLGFFPTTYAAGLIMLLAAPLAVALCDARVAHYFASHQLRGDLRRVVDLSEAFGHGATVALIFIACATSARNRLKQVAQAAWATIAGGIVANLIKLGVARTRPSAWTGDDVWSTFGEFLPGKLAYTLQSFPSGHTATAFAFACSLSWLFPGGSAMFYLFATLTAIQRVQGQAHFVSDVLCGAAVGLITARRLLGSRASSPQT